MDNRTRFTQIQAKFETARKNTAEGPFAHTSLLWQETLAGRANFPTYEEFDNLLSRTSSFTQGIGMVLRPLSEEEYAIQYRTWVSRYADEITARELAQWPEPKIGSPTILEFNGYRASVIYIKNFALSHVIETIVDRHHARKSGLKVLEIGAGYGGVAEILIRKGRAKSYTIVDLPENLFLGCQFLQLNFPDMNGVICDRATPSTFEETDLRFLFPNDIALLNEKFDLVVNTASLGEMSAATAQAYVQWISSHLSQDGLFVSHNADHTRDLPDVVQRHSEYGYDRFSLVRIYSQPSPASPFHQVHIVATLGAAKADGPVLKGRSIDFISALLNIGLAAELDGVLASLTVPQNAAHEAFLQLIHELFAARTALDKYVVAARRVEDPDCDAALDFIQGALAFAANDAAACPHFLKYLAHGRSPIAIVFAVPVITVWGRCEVTAQVKKNIDAALRHVPPHMIKQMETMKLNVISQRFIRYFELVSRP